ncbi:uncharacterized protein LOC119395883 isoform X4 [Rhipicephalus sanguineus]|uniref:uncharacterized protein LOC119395883 isoform X4 n=1 Tax=Rhipicephalus sanguineus TaxID=34632 RepID=UPI0020C268BC|nr:uncharacterized protein LOC119395883 isoform X4 [Rhipicephalus sanguineus]
MAPPRKVRTAAEEADRRAARAAAARQRRAQQSAVQREAQTAARRRRREDSWVRFRENYAKRLRREDPQPSPVVNLTDILSLRLFELISSAGLVHHVAAASSVPVSDVAGQLDPGSFTEHEGNAVVSVSAPSTNHKEEQCEQNTSLAGCQTRTGREYHRKLMWNSSAQGAVIARNTITMQTKPQCKKSVYRIPVASRPLETGSRHVRTATESTQTATKMTHSMITQTKPKKLRSRGTNTSSRKLS